MLMIKLALAFASIVYLGAASAFLNTGSYSFAAQAYPDDVEKAIAIIEAIVGIGCAAGPMLGSITYELIGFA